MPRYRTPHKTDGPGIGRKLRGQDLAKRLDKLADMAGHHHSEVARHWTGWLDHAKEAGDALLEAKRRLGHRRKWSKWRNRNIINTMSKETACNYMRIAREWDDARLVHARASGVKLDSIRSVLRVLRGEPLPEKDPRDRLPGETDLNYWKRQGQYDASPEGKARSRKHKVDRMRKKIRNEFSLELRTLNGNEIRVLSEQFKTHLWDKLHNEICNTACAIFGGENREDTATAKIANEKIRKAYKKRKMDLYKKRQMALSGQQPDESRS